MNTVIERPRRISAYFAVFALIEFIIYYILTLISDNYSAVYYYFYFAERFITLAIPVVAVSMLIRQNRGTRKTVIATLLISLSRAIFFIPFFYLEYVYGPYDSVEGIALSLLTTLVTVIIHALIMLLIWRIMRLIIGRCAHSEKYSSEYPLPYLRFDNCITLSVSAVSFAVFAINLVFEIISTVSFFIDNGTVYYVDEILLIVFSYIYLIVLFFGIHLGSCFLTNKCVKQVAASEIEE